MGLLVLRYGAAWGFMNPKAFDDNYLPFTMLMIVSTTICYLVFSFAGRDAKDE